MYANTVHKDKINKWYQNKGKKQMPTYRLAPRWFATTVHLFTSISVHVQARSDIQKLKLHGSDITIYRVR